MKRREAVKKMALVMGGVLSAPTLSVLLESCTTDKKRTDSKEFSEEEKEMIKRISDIIIPETDTPGAVQAEVPEFIEMMVRETYPEKMQEEFQDGLAAFDKFCQHEYKDNFISLSEEKQKEAVIDLDKQVLGDKELEEEDLQFYRTFKDLTLLGFFTSETGATETLRYVQTPGSYDGCVEYKEGDKVWAT